MIFIIMERDDKIIEMYNSDITATEISKELNIGRRTIYRVLQKHEIPLQKSSEKKCLICDKASTKNLCPTCNTNLRRYRVKLLSVEYLGNKCMRCGWAGDLSGFDFHHINPKLKDFNPNAMQLANRSWTIVKKELDKCELLCALCHRKEHSNYDLLKEVSVKYKGKIFKK